MAARLLLVRQDHWQTAGEFGPVLLLLPLLLLLLLWVARLPVVLLLLLLASQVRLLVQWPAPSPALGQKRLALTMMPV